MALKPASDLMKVVPKRTSFEISEFSLIPTEPEVWSSACQIASSCDLFALSWHLALQGLSGNARTVLILKENPSCTSVSL